MLIKTSILFLGLNALDFLHESMEVYFYTKLTMRAYEPIQCIKMA